MTEIAKCGTCRQPIEHIPAANADIRARVDQLDAARHTALAAGDYARADRLSRLADAVLTSGDPDDYNHDGHGIPVPVPQPGVFH